MAKIRFTGPEKRAYLRVSSHCAMRYTKLSKKLRPLINMITRSSTENICAKGVKFIVRKKIPMHAILEFQFRIPENCKIVTGLGEVVRVRLKSSGKSYDVGMKFLWMKRENIELIDTYVRKKIIQKVIKKLHKK